MGNGNRKQQVEFLFFVEKKSIVEISKIINMSRKTVGDYLGGLPGYAEEKERRKQENSIMRKKYQRDWDKANRGNRYSMINGESLRHEHELAVAELSREKYFKG